VSVPADTRLSVRMKMDNWAFGTVQGRPRGENKNTERPTGTERPSR